MNRINNENYCNTTLAKQASMLAELHPNEVAIRFDDGQVMTFGEAWRQGLTLASAMQRAGVPPGATLSFQLPNIQESVIVAIAASICGLVINPVVPIYRGRELNFILRDANTEVLFIPGRYRQFDYPSMIADLKSELPALKQVICVRAEGELPQGFAHFEDFLVTGDSTAAQTVEVSPDDTKILLYTSGTTGNPKAVQHSHNTLAAALDNGVTGWDLSATDLMLMPSPVTHITGYVNGIELPFFSPTKSLLMEAWDVNAAVELIEKHGATVCVSATPFLQELVSTCADSGKTLPGFRLFACGGASVPPALIYRASQTLANCMAVRVYGSTETPLVTVGFPEPEHRELAAETDGRIHNYEVRICDDAGSDVGIDAEGEILVRGPAMMLGYVDAAQNSAAYTADGFFQTGDIGKLLPSGALVITDRKKDIIIRGGENLSAREIEEAILQHPDIKEIAVVSAPHSRLGEGVAAYIVTHSNKALSLESILELLSTLQVAKQKWPQHLEVVDALPKTASGKVQKEILRKQLKDKGVLL